MNNQRLFRTGLVSGLLLAASTLVGAASGVYMEPEQFISEAFDGKPATGSALWLSGPLRDQVVSILGHPPGSARQRYWRSGQRSVWILNEIGKEQPITAGFVVEDNQIISSRVLVFRESRGWEIRNQNFTRQFKGAGLNNLMLDQPIDGITGATLSVRAMRKMARLALLYHGHVLSAGTRDQP